MSAALPEKDELLAAELAVGLLDPPERQAAEARVGMDDGFAEAYARWQSYAAAMIDHPGEAPDPWVWRAIEARLPANDSAPSVPMSLRWWKAGTLVASTAAVLLGFAALQKPQAVIERSPVIRPSPPMVAVLTGKQGFVTISFDPASGRMTSAVTGLDLGEHSPELWAIPADGRPRSMGVMNASAPDWAKVPAPAAAVMAAGVTIAVSVEPVGGSPIGRPTGPVILTGKLTTA